MGLDLHLPFPYSLSWIEFSDDFVMLSLKKISSVFKFQSPKIPSTDAFFERRTGIFMFDFSFLKSPSFGAGDKAINHHLSGTRGFDGLPGTLPVGG